MKEKKTEERIDELFNDSRRSFMKKGAVASSALALGVGTGTAAGESSVLQPNQTLMFAYDYIPNQTLAVVTRLQQSVTTTILGDEDIVSDASEWNSYIANYQLQGDTPGEYVLVFTRGGQLQDEFDLGASATFFNDEYNLLEVTVEG